jgi:hypothetical protein
VPKTLATGKKMPNSNGMLAQDRQHLADCHDRLTKPGHVFTHGLNIPVEGSDFGVERSS